MSEFIWQVEEKRLTLGWTSVPFGDRGGGMGGGGSLGKVSDPDLDPEMRGKTVEAPRKNFARPFAPFIVFQGSCRSCCNYWQLDIWSN